MILLWYFEVLVFSVQAFKEITQILFQIYWTHWKNYYWYSTIQLPTVWNHYYFFNITINIRIRFAPYNYSKSTRNEKILFTLQKNHCTRKAWIAALNGKEDTSVQSQQNNVKLTLRRGLFLRYFANLHS